MSLVLARSIKEHARRGGDALGFSIDSGDCLAFKYYRDVRSYAPLLTVSSLCSFIARTLAHICMLLPSSFQIGRVESVAHRSLLLIKNPLPSVTYHCSHNSSLGKCAPTTSPDSIGLRDESVASIPCIIRQELKRS